MSETKNETLKKKYYVLEMNDYFVSDKRIVKKKCRKKLNLNKEKVVIKKYIGQFLCNVS